MAICISQVNPAEVPFSLQEAHPVQFLDNGLAGASLNACMLLHLLCDKNCSTWRWHASMIAIQKRHCCQASVIKPKGRPRRKSHPLLAPRASMRMGGHLNVCWAVRSKEVRLHDCSLLVSRHVRNSKGRPASRPRAGGPAYGSSSCLPDWHFDILVELSAGRAKSFWESLAHRQWILPPGCC